jgi:ATP-dependent DNA helicase RecG
MEERENEHLEFKEAKNRYDFEELDADVVEHRNGRILIFNVPSRPIGTPVQYKGAYWMRGGDALVSMTPDVLKRIFEEAGPDFSAEICRNAALADLDSGAIRQFRELWQRKSGNKNLSQLTDKQLLIDAELLVDDAVTYAALILLGKKQALGRHLGQAEVVWEYRSSADSVAFQQRKEFRQAFFLFHNELWELINLRNDFQQYQEGLFIWDIPTFNEVVVREAILNAISHRDYRLSGSIFVRQFPSRLEITSPGGFPPGITIDNLLWRQNPRNRRIAEVFAKCGLVGRSGQGADRMFERCIREGKPRPDYRDTDEYQVSLALQGEIHDLRFLSFLEQVSTQTSVSFSVEDLLILDDIHKDETVPPQFKDRLNLLRERGVVETTGRGRGTRYILSRRFYSFIGKRGVYTRKRGLDREANKALIIKHLDTFGRAGISELEEALPGLARSQIHSLLRDLRKEERVRRVGEKRGSQWELS